MIATKPTSATLLLLLLVASASAALDRRDGSTITVSTTQFNPAETNQGGTTNSAGTFNVSPLATSSSYAFQTLSQTSTFTVGSLNTQSANYGGGSGSGSGGGSGGSGGSGASASSGNIGGGTVVVTATAATSTVSGASSSGGSASSGTSSSGLVTGSNGFPSLALQASNGALPLGMDGPVWSALGVMLLSVVAGAAMVL